MRSKSKDLHFGFKKEKEVLKILNDKYDGRVKQNSRYATFDFELDDGSIQWELKSRRCCSYTYPTMMLSYHKILKAQENLEKKTIFLFNLKDGLFQWEYDEDDFEVELGGTMSRGSDERHMCAFIPITSLRRFQ